MPKNGAVPLVGRPVSDKRRWMSVSTRKESTRAFSPLRNVDDDVRVTLCGCVGNCHVMGGRQSPTTSANQPIDIGR